MSDDNIDQSFSEEVEATEVDSQEQTTNEQVSENVEAETEAQAEEDAEIDYEGEKFRVPPKLKDAFLRMADYTQKTQEVAESRKTVEGERAAFEQERQLATQSYQRQQANLQAYANLSALDGKLEQYGSVNWQAWSDQDPVEAQKAFFEYNQSKDQRSQLAQYIYTQEQQAQQQEAQTAMQMAERGKEVLSREIPNWSPETAKGLRSTGAELGFKDAELAQILDPRHVKTLYYAKIGLEALKKANASKPTAQAVPVKTIKSSGSAGGNADPEKMSVDDWLKWRNKQVRK
jgi:hypothetical protein